MEMAAAAIVPDIAAESEDAAARLLADNIPAG